MNDVQATRHTDRSEEMRLRRAIQVIIRWCDRTDGSPEGQCLYEIEQGAMKALGIGGAGDPLADLRHGCLAALGFLGGVSILSKEQLEKVLVDAVKGSGSFEKWSSA
jgi:hypothetical protein